jgi:PAS domain S-box-containing protein
LNAYLLIPLLSGTACTSLAVWILTMDSRSRASRRAATLVAGGSWWSLCEVLWAVAPDPGAALWWIRLSSVGWVAIGPLGLEFLLEISGGSPRWMRRTLPFLYATSALFLGITLATSWIHTAALPMPWGYGYELGPTYLLFYPFTSGCLLVGLIACARRLRRTASAADQSQLGWVAAGVTVPLVVASTTDGLLPYFGIQVVHLATASFVFLGATVAWSFHRYGHSLLAPTTFAREILETLPDGVALVHPDGRVRSANARLAQLTGLSVSELDQVCIEDRLRGWEPAEVPEGAERECELVGARRAVPVAVTWSRLRDKRGLELGRVIVVRDVTELVELRRRLVTSGRLAAVGELAAGIAHEINNPIAYVGTNLGTLRQYWAELAKLALPDGPGLERLVGDGEELVDECLEGVRRVELIVRDVKGFSHASGDTRSLLDVNALLDSALRVIGPRLGGTRIETSYGPVPLVRISGRRLQQVMLNLLVNAAHAVGHDGTVRLTTRSNGNWVELLVEDDGCGMPPEVLERVFDPFFTTKRVDEGTGLGLAICYQIVRDHGGDISLDSTPGAGTRARVRLPAEAAPEAPTPDVAVPAEDEPQLEPESDR